MLMSVMIDRPAARLYYVRVVKIPLSRATGHVKVVKVMTSLESQVVAQTFAMGIHNLALSLLLLALFTLSSVVLFEISTPPPIVKQRQELFVAAFVVDEQFDSYSDYERSIGYLPDLDYFTNSPSVSPSSNTHRSGTLQENARSKDITQSTASPYPEGGGVSESLKQRPSALVSDMNGSLAQHDDTLGSQLVTVHIQSSMRGMQQLADGSPTSSTQLVQYVNKVSTPAAKIQAQVRRSKPQLGHTARHRYVNRNNTNAALRRKRVPPKHPPSRRPRRQGLNCTDAQCVSYLLDADYRSFTVCQQWAEKKTRVKHETINATCKFMKGIGRPPVGLVSVPGSGNTWVRGLLEKATGICTGSIYCDHPLRNGGMIGEYVKSGSVLVVKTHTSDYQWKDVEPEQRNKDDALYGSAILLIRNPFNAFIAEWNRVNALSSYLGRPVDQRRPMLNRSMLHSRRKPSVPLSKVNSTINQRRPMLNRSMLHSRRKSSVPLSKVNSTRFRTFQDYRRKTVSSSWKRQRLLHKESVDNATQLYSKTLTSRGEKGNESVPLVGRKLLALPAVKKLKEDVSHTIEIDKKMFGKHWYDLILV